MIEIVEPRLMLSGTAPHKKVPSLPKGYTVKPTYQRFHHDDGIHPDSYASPISGSRSVNAVRGAYGLGIYNSASALSYAGIQGTGAGQTIAIVDAYDYPTMVADLTAFDAYYGLPAPPSLTRVGQTGSATSLPAAQSPSSNSWEGEEALDVEWAHAMAPQASIVLVEATNNSGNNLYIAAQTAASLPGVSVVSMSWGGGEFSTETSYDTTYFIKAGVTFLASTGDTGGAREYPSTSPNVLAVGGTNLGVTGSNASGYVFSSESAWSAGGGGISAYESIPTYQVGNINGASATKRTVPDIAGIADNNNSPVSVYDSYDNGTTTPWDAVGGTSVAAPVWAGMIAVVNQGRVLEGLFPLNTGATATTTNPTQAATRLYQLAAADFHDVTTGSNGNAAGTGYDMATGRGTPTAKLLTDLAGAGTVTARVYYDANRNGAYDAGETAISGTTVYLDLNNNNVQNSLEPSAVTNSSGLVTFTDQVGGGKAILTGAAPSGYTAVTTGTAISYGATSTNTQFTYVQTTLSYTSANDNTVVTLRLDSTGNTEQLIAAGSVVGSAAVANGTPIVINLTGANQSLLIDSTNGNPLSTGGLTLTGTATGNTTLSLYGTPAGDAYTFAQTYVAFSGRTITLANVANRLLNPGSGTNSLNVASGSVTIPAANPGTGITTESWSSIAVSTGATLSFGTSSSHPSRYLVLTAGLSVGGTIDLGGNDMVIQNGSLAAVNGSAATGFNGGLWNGTGLQSSAAGGDPSHLTALGVGSGSLASSFDGYTPSANDVLVKFTYYGDANLDGKVDGSDYSLVDFGLASGSTGFAAGDFDYSGTVDGSDYSLMDNAYNSQTSNL